MFQNQQRKFIRSARLVKILTKYGFRDVLSRLNVATDNTEDADGNIVSLSFYERVRRALEDLGPTFVKLGQSVADREDLLSKAFIDQLRHLQDNVATQPMDVRTILIDEFGPGADDFFAEIPDTPIAAASIAQVYKAKMQDGKYAIIKIKRPGIDRVIADDLLILKDLVQLIDIYTDYAEQLNLKYAIQAFEQSLKEELSLSNEKSNILQFRENYPRSKKTYVPNVYEAFCSDRVLTMEFVDGMKVTDIAALKAAGVDPVKIASRGFSLYISQVIDHGLFHADPHAGNMMVSPKGQLVFIDFGAVGRISELDIPLFEQLILGFMMRKANKVVRMLKKMAIYFKIPDEQKLERDVYEIMTYVHNSSLKDISVPKVMEMMKDVLRDNRLVMPNYFYLLFKGVSLLDGVGRQLNPDMDVMKSLRPHVKKIVKRKLSPEALAEKGMERAADWLEDAEDMPNVFRSLVNKFNENSFTVGTELKQIDRLENVFKTYTVNLIIGLIICAHVVVLGMFWVNGFLWPTIGAALAIIVLTLVLAVRVMRR